MPGKAGMNRNVFSLVLKKADLNPFSLDLLVDSLYETFSLGVPWMAQRLVCRA